MTTEAVYAFDRAYAAAKDTAQTLHGPQWMFNPLACLGRVVFPLSLVHGAHQHPGGSEGQRSGWLPHGSLWPSLAAYWGLIEAGPEIIPLDLSGQNEEIKPAPTSGKFHPAYLMTFQRRQSR